MYDDHTSQLIVFNSKARFKRRTLHVPNLIIRFN